MKKLILPLFCCLFLLCGCGNTEIETDAPNAEATVLTHIFRGKELSFPDNFELHPQVVPHYDSETDTLLCAAMQKREENGEIIPEYFLLTVRSGNLVSAEPLFSNMDEAYRLHGGMFSDGDLVCALTITDPAGGMRTFHAAKYSPADGKLTVSESIGTALTGYAYIETVLTDMVGDLYLFTGDALLMLRQDFEPLGMLSFVSAADSITVSPDGTVYVFADFGSGQALYPVDKERKALGDPVHFAEDGYIRDALFSADGTLYYTTETGMLADHGEENNLIMHFANSGVSLFDLTVLSVHSPNAFLALSGSGVTYFEKAPDVDLSAVSVIEIAAVSTPYRECTDFIHAYNRTHPEVRIVLLDYYSERTVDDRDAGIRRLTTEILTGVTHPDIVFGTQDSAVMRTLIRDRLYLDLYPFIDADETVSREDFFGGYLRAFSDGDRLWGITPEITVSTLLGTPVMLGNRVSWTIGEMLDFAASLPENTALTDPMSRSNIDRILFGSGGYGVFADLSSGTAQFDTDVFRAYLELIRPLPETTYTGTGELHDFNTEQFLRRKNGQTAVTDLYISSAFEWSQQKALFGTEDIVRIGYPTSDGKANGHAVSASHAFVLCSFTDCADQAWKFVRDFALTPSIHGFPVTKAAYDDQIRAETEKVHVVLYSGGGSSRTYNPAKPITADDLDEPGAVFRFTAEDAADLRDFLDNAGFPLTDMLPEAADAIVREEISSFRSGMRTADECAQRIQSRVEIWLSEHE